MSARWTLALLLLVACGEPPLAADGEWRATDHPQPEQGAAPNPSRAPRTERSTDPLAAAAALWTVTCASCHGRAGLGDGPSAPGPMVSFASPDWQRANDDAAIAAVIREGRNMMPPFGETIAPEGISALVALIRRFGGAAPSAAPGAAPSTAPGAAPSGVPGAAPSAAPGTAPSTAPGTAPSGAGPSETAPEAP